MNISEHLVKEYWKRRVHPDGGFITLPTGSSDKYQAPVSINGSTYVYLTQEAFMDEMSPAAHGVNSKFMSTRPIYKPSGEKDKNGKEKWVIAGYDDVETVSLGLQLCIALKKASHFAADGFNVSNETTDKRRFDKLNSYKDSVGLNVAFMEAVNSCFRTGDSAIYLYQTETGIDYEVFSRLKGDILYPDIDENRNPMLFREYQLKGKKAVDVFTTKYRETWIMVDEEAEDTGFLDKVRKWFKQDTREKSEDGYTLFSRTDAQAGKGLLQVIYFRIDDVPSGPAELSIEALEKALSYVSEEVKNSAFPILFLKSEKIINLPPSATNGKTIGARGTSEAIKNSDAKYLTPPDASNIAELNINTLSDNILRTTMSVFIEPDIMKSGADSSTSIKILYGPEIQWCQNMWPCFYKGIKQLMEVFKVLVSKVEQDPGFIDLKTSVWQNIWIPQNTAEAIKNELDQVYARTKSRSAAMQDIGNQHIDDEKQIMKEWEEELRIKSEIPAQINAKYGSSSGSSSGDNDNPNKPDIDNNSPGKSITD